MSDDKKVGLFLFVIWLIGLQWVAFTHNVDNDTRILYLTAPMWVPLLIIVILQVLVWIGQIVNRSKH